MASQQSYGRDALVRDLTPLLSFGECLAHAAHRDSPMHDGLPRVLSAMEHSNVIRSSRKDDM